MPRTLVRAPGHDRMRSLGGLAVAWIEALVRHGPGAVQGMEVALNDEYAGFILDAYALLPDGKRHYDHCFLSRPKGTNKSGLAAYLSLFEALGPARFCGFAVGGEKYEDPWGLGFEYEYEPGEPMGKHVHVPMIRIMATEEGQTGNVYDTIYYNLTDEDCPLSHIVGIDPGRTRVYLPNGGFVVPSTASSAAKDGGKETFRPAPAAIALRGPGGTACRRIRRKSSVQFTRTPAHAYDRDAQLGQAAWNGIGTVVHRDHDNVRARRGFCCGNHFS